MHALLAHLVACDDDTGRAGQRGRGGGGGGSVSQLEQCLIIDTNLRQLVLLITDLMLPAPAP